MNCFIGCSKDKKTVRSKAKDLYTGDMFKKSYEYAESLNPDKIYILSGKYGLVNPDTEINPYDLYISDKPIEWRKKWAENVIKQMKAAHIDFEAETYFMAGEDYIEFLREYFPNKKEIFKHKGLGMILHYLDNKLKKINKIKNIKENMKSITDFIKESMF